MINVALELAAIRPATEDGISDEAIRILVGRLNATCRRSTLGFAMATGELIVRELYKGDLASFRQRSPQKDASLRRLAHHPDLAMSPAVIYRSVAFYELFQRTDGHKWEHLTTSHLRLVLPISPSDQERLLESAESQRWSVERLDYEVSLLPKGHGMRGGRRRRSALVVAVTSLQRSLSHISKVLEHESDASPESRREAATALERALLLGQTLAKQLKCIDSTPALEE